MNTLKNYIQTCFALEKSLGNEKEALEKIEEVFNLLRSGQLRVAEKTNNVWIVNEWLKQAILLAFRFKKSSDQIYDGYDKLGVLPTSTRYRKVSGAVIRDGVFVANNAIIMPSYINVGAYIDENTMIDINSSIGSCAQIGKNCHIAANAVIGGVLEPIVAKPVIIEDNCFIGASSCVLEGVIVEENSIIASGVVISSSTKIIDRQTQKQYVGIIPSGSVVVAGSYPSSGGVNISCAVIIKKTDATSRQKTSINEILRD